MDDPKFSEEIAFLEITSEKVFDAFLKSEDNEETLKLSSVVSKIQEAIKTLKEVG